MDGNEETPRALNLYYQFYCNIMALHTNAGTDNCMATFLLSTLIGSKIPQVYSPDKGSSFLIQPEAPYYIAWIRRCRASNEAWER